MKFAGYLHTGYYVGFLLASIANYTIGANYGWRWMFAFGGLPALFVGWIMSNVKESHRFEEMKKTTRPSMKQSFGALFTPQLQEPHDRDVAHLPRVDHRAVGRIDLRADRAITQIALRAGRRSRRRRGAHGVLRAERCWPIGTVIGLPAARRFCAERFGRRVADGHLPVVADASTTAMRVRLGVLPDGATRSRPSSCHDVLPRPARARTSRCIRCGCRSCIETSSRGSGMGFISSIGRFVGVGMVFLIAAGVEPLRQHRHARSR